MKTVFGKLGSIARRGSSADGTAGPTNSGGSSTQKVSALEQQVAAVKAASEERKKREIRLASLKPIVLDATLVECLSSGYESIEDKLRVFQAIRKSGVNDILLAAFVRGQTPDVQFLQALRSQQLIDAQCWASSELFDANGSDLPGQDLPYGLAKMIQYGIQNAVLECDLAAPFINWEKYSTEDFCALLESRCRWVSANLYAGRPQPPAAWVRLRDFREAMQSAPARALSLVDFLARLEAGVRPAGLLLQMPVGWLPTDAAAAVRAVRAVMEAAGWSEGQIILSAAAGAAAAGTGGGGAGRAAAAAAGGSGAGGGVSGGGGGGLGVAAVLEGLAAGGSGVMAAMWPGEGAPSLPGLLALAAGGGNAHVAAAYGSAKLRDAAAAVAAAAARAAEAAAAAVADDGEPALADFAPPQRPPRGSPSAASTGPQRAPLIPGHA